jgi:PepSY-associated TM region
MNIGKLLDWRKVLIYSHRWLGIAVGIIFVSWCVSGAVLMYYGMPTLTAGERLARLEPLDLSSVRVTPADAVRNLHLKDPFRLRVSMQGGRPVYRINTGRVFGKWTVVYADTGEKMAPMNADGAMDWMRRTRPEMASRLRYDAYLTKPDHYVRIPAMQPLLPMHRISVGDAAGTQYYVSEVTGEAVVRADRIGRILGFAGYTMHRFFWWRQKSWFYTVLAWFAWMGIVMCLTGLAVGIWLLALTPRFRKKTGYSHSPYSGWMKWHHVAGLIFGLVTFTWIFSGAVDVPAVPGVDVFGPSSNFTKVQLALGARSPQGAGSTVDLEPITLERLHRAFEAVNSVFAPKELEFLQVGAKPYFVAYRPPASQSEVEQWSYRTQLDFLTPLLDKEHVLASITNPERGAFRRFDDDSMMQIAKAAMPGAAVKEAQWLNEFDDYYYYSVPSFNLGLMKPVKTLPVLRVTFADSKETRIYMSPSHGQMLKSEINDRVARWSMYGLHALDFSFLYQHRPVWDIVVWALLIGSTVLSSTTLVPMFRRLKRHAGRLSKRLAGSRERPSSSVGAVYDRSYLVDSRKDGR